MSTSRRTSASYVSIKTLGFPDVNTDYNVQKWPCSHTAAIERTHVIQPHQIGTPVIFSIKKSIASPSPQNTTPSIKSLPKAISKKTSSVSTSRKMHDTHHKESVKARKAEFKRPCPGSGFIGTPNSLIGNFSLEQAIPGKKRITLTENPRKRFCLKNPKVLHYKPLPARVEQANIRRMVKTAENMVKTAENMVTSSGSQSAISSICEVIDLANPLNLDFQGMDYKNTYMRDEQGLQNQMEYRKLRRYKHRRNMKAGTIENTKKFQQNERIAIPKHFEVENPTPSELIDRPVHRIMKPDTFGKLIRAEGKPEVREQIKQEEANRKERYKQLYLQKKKRDTEREEEKKLKEMKEARNTSNLLAEKDIADLVQILDRTITTKKMTPRVIPKRRDFPHTLEETLQFRHDLKKSKRIYRDKAKIKQELYEQIGRPKRYNEADLEVSSELQSPSALSEVHSTNDEDDMEVGQRGSKFLLRGWLYKMGSNLRGKFHQKDVAKPDRKVKSCMTREEWFETLLSRKIIFFLAEKPESLMELSPRAVRLNKMPPKTSMKEFIKKPLGRHYERVIRRNLRIKKPKLIKVRKFNLINYLYSIGSRRKSVGSLSSSGNVDKTMEYMRTRAKLERIKRRSQKYRRMHYLGISCPSKGQKRTRSVCVNSDSADSDWIPEDTYELDTVEHLSLKSRGNMPAPANRESTLRCHPRHPRDYKGLRIPSDIFDETIKKSDVPILKKLKDDKYFAENVRQVKETEFGKKFEARHHHDHWDPTQHKSVHITYARTVVKPKLLQPEEQNTQEKVPKTFAKARPRGDTLDVDVNYALPKCNTDEIIKEFNAKPGAYSKKKIGSKLEPFPKMADMIYHSLEQRDLREFRGREKFTEFLIEIKEELGKRAGLVHSALAIDRNVYLAELQEDLKSIESCLSSLSSSACTNLTNDSGSFLLAGDKKIPLDYIRKSLVPFEEINRSRFEALPIDAAKEEEDPFYTVPFAGQEKEQMIAATPKDSFFTFNTRLQNGKRLRLDVKHNDRRKQLLGTRKGVKAVSHVATDIDERYIEDLKNRPSLKPFKWNSCRTMIKDALRKNFESMLIQGEIVRTKIYDRRNEEYFQQLLSMKTLLKRLFSKWEKREYEAAMEVVYKVKPYYEATDKYRREAYELGKQYDVLNMEIVYIENDWMRRTILQNFHYLLADMEWRVEHDWIHRTRDGDLEGFEESIAKRNTANIRQRDKDDAWAIKEFYDNVYLQNYHPVIVVFKNASEFLNGFENLKSKTFILLLELHYTLWILAELDQKYQEFSVWCSAELESKKTYAQNKCVNKYYMEDRANQLKKQVHVYLGKPIDASFNDRRLSVMKGVCNEVYKDVVPASSQMDSGPLEQVAIISQVLTDLIGRFEAVNPETRRRIEARYRRLLNYRRNLSKQAVLTEKRIAAEMMKVRRNLAAPFKKPIHKGKLPRSELKNTVRVSPPKAVKISEKTKFFYQAFHDEGDLEGFQEARESLDIIDNIQESIVPFYFDYFLSVNGYQPNYNFKTQIELRDGPEIDRFQIKSLLPEVLGKFEKWQVMKKKSMEENINKNPKMYHNVQI